MRMDNPFATPVDAERQLAPAGPCPPAPMPSMATAPPFVTDDNGAEVTRALAAAACNPILACAARLIWLAGRFANFTPRDVGTLRDCLADEIRRIGTHSTFDTGTRAAACYALAATFDDLALNAAWSSGDAWARNTLVSLMFNEACGGERFFDLLAQLQHNPRQNADTLTLMSLCLALGFQGKFRVLPDGAAQLALIRTKLSRMLEETANPQDQQGLARPSPINAPYRAPLISRAALALSIALSATILGLGAVMTATLASRMETAASDAARLIPGRMPRWLVATENGAPLPVLQRPTTPRPQEVSAALPEAAPTHLRRMLAQEIADGRVSVVEGPGIATVRLIDRTLFASASATLSATTRELLGAVAKALEGLSPTIAVVGHADNQPIRTPQIGSNAVLAKRRAEAVAAALREQLPSGVTITPEGRGDREPLASNATPEGRARNRRVEIIIPAGQAASAPPP
ncbi:type IVB secretion system protein IcmH/DotU [Chelatococcus asaccharovorans]|uniref:type IVB secretion system protein IcmH/DotU n=1 Tax=Chelatococcus asaccharovorans TaxID=28210 RepID=UPI00224C6C0D|nr:type IVB secretion system protein IcmH/DotU [Chelatococcus asaccharovorans]CAH1661963.1 Type VI secretion system protein ImpK [Chelatococcus asaccharovorans]CAH1683311.1 Type VI secretion system protein ImpK [Chelatococcus asaccharovorans]